MFSANQIAGFLNWLYLQSVKIKKHDFLHVEKLVEKYWGGRGQKWVWPPRSKDTKIGYTSKSK